MTVINPKLIHVPKHRRDAMVSASLADNLREVYKKRTLRVVKGDSVKVLRGEYKGVEGKVENVDTEHGTLNIEGVQREKIKGGQVKVPIHASKVMITNLNLSDKYRSNKVQGDNPREPPAKVTEEKVESQNSKEDKEEKE
ncbi:MAG TPA: 50S ribosomal protein L24 [Nitrososphaera sp.]|nr:50S ribosomal protein L24 [Nitrososphaera sp.]